MKLFFFFIAVLILPLAIIISRNGAVIEVGPMLASSAGFALLLYALINLLRKFSPRVVALAGALLLLGIMSTRYLLGFLYDFSGQGFSSEFFAHISRTSFEVGLQEYDHEAWVILIVFSVICWITVRMISNQPEIRLSRSIALIPVSVLMIYAGASASPEVQLAQAYSRYIQPTPDEQGVPLQVIQDQSRELLQSLRTTNALPIQKKNLEVVAPEKPLNLIIVYLESFNEVLSQNEYYPGLTPKIDALKKQFHHFDQIHSSGYVTIEGIANSQCGTLFNMDYANSSLVTRRGRLLNLPCLGDILKLSGYQQYYLGGAELEFAGKGSFLREHGYDRVWGWEHWDDQGYTRFNDWGLSDTHLFAEALATIQTLHQEARPFNLTLLTLGMHTPGFVYDECPVYTKDKTKPFVNAIHCTDYLLGDFVQQLEKSGVLEDTVLFMQADHGSFLTPQIIKQVGNRIRDSRLLTLMALPESHSIDPKDLRTNAEGSNLNMVTTLLDVLDISHNTDFILSQSHFQGEPVQSYFPSRRQDYMQGQRIDNDRLNCEETERNSPVSLPLDDCDKSRVMQTIAALNLTYSPAAGVENRVCELDARIDTDTKSGKLKVNWGNQNLSDQFYRRGSKRNKHQTEGIYGVLLDEHNSVMQTLFFEPFREEDMNDISELYKSSSSGQQLLLIRNADARQQPNNIQELWPEQLREHTVIYGEFENGKLVPEYTSSAPLTDIQFKPGNCEI